LVLHCVFGRNEKTKWDRKGKEKEWDGKEKRKDAIGKRRKIIGRERKERLRKERRYGIRKGPSDIPSLQARTVVLALNHHFKA